MRILRVFVSIFVILYVFFAVSDAFYGGIPKEPAKTPLRLIVKFAPDQKIDLQKLSDGKVIIGLEGSDKINNQAKLKDFKRVFDRTRTAANSRFLKNIFVLTFEDHTDLTRLAKEYEKLPYVEYAHPDHFVELYETPDDPLYSHQYSLNNTGQGFYHVLRRDGTYNDSLVLDTGLVDADIDAQEYYDNPPDRTETVVVAIIDTGVDIDHPDLADHIWINPNEIPDNDLDDDHNGYIDDIHGWDFCGDVSGLNLNPDNDPTDQHGHGTHCAGIVTAITGNGTGVAGVNAKAKIMALKFYPTPILTLTAKAIVYAADNGADVISMSWGTPFDFPILSDALNYAAERGVTLVAAAGNDGMEYYNYPASHPKVITVSASDCNDEITHFSTFGNNIEVCAPGQSVLSLKAEGTDMYGENGEPDVHVIDDGYYLASGTSMSCPYVAAVASAIESASPGISRTVVQNILESTCDDIVDPFGQEDYFPGWDMYSGYGRINVYNAVNAVPDLKVEISSPHFNQLVSGSIDITGTAEGTEFSSFILEYRSTADSGWTELNSSTTPAYDEIIGTLNTTGLQGEYLIRLSSGATHEEIVSIFIANSSICEIGSPLPDDTVQSGFYVYGKAFSPDMRYYRVELRAQSSGSWQTINENTQPVYDGILAFVDFGASPNDTYIIKVTLANSGGTNLADSVVVNYTSILNEEDNWTISGENSMFPVANYGDIDGDGENEIIVGTDEGVSFFNTDGSPKTDNIPYISAYNCWTQIPVGSLNGDNIDDFVVISSNVNKSKMLGIMFICKSGETVYSMTLPQPPRINTSYTRHQRAKIWLKDIDYDGINEIHYMNGWTSISPDNEYYIFDSNGNQICSIPNASTGDRTFRNYITADFDNDGTDEIYALFGNLYQFDIDGTIQDSLVLTDYDHNFGITELSIVDIDDDGIGELVATSISNVTGSFWIFAFDNDFTIMDGWPRNTRIDDFYSPFAPIFTDLDGDNELEYYISFYTMESAVVYGWSIDGHAISGYDENPIFATAPDPATTTYLSSADFDGDSKSDLVMVANPDIYLSFSHERLIAWNWGYDILDKWPIFTSHSSQYKYDKAPTIGDINQDGYIDLLIHSSVNDLSFINFEGVYFDESEASSTTLYYNRRHNRVGYIYRQNEICGDVTGNGQVNLLDITALIAYLYGDGGAPVPMWVADVNSDILINLLDITYLIRYLYEGGPAPQCTQ